MKTSYLFPSPIWIHDFSDKNEVSHLLKLSKIALDEVHKSGDADRRSNRGNSFHTLPNFLGNFQDTPLHKLITPLLVRALKEYGYDPSFIVSVTYWSIVSYDGAFNERHHHANSVISGAFYVEAPKGSGALVFADPRYGKLMESRIGRNEAQIHKNQRIVPQNGRLVLFPSYLEHQVEMSTCSDPRIIYSFNVDIHGPNTSA